MVRTVVYEGAMAADDGDNLGPVSNMQIRSVPEVVRKYWNDQAHAAEATLGEVFTKHTLGLMTGGATVVATAVYTPLRMDELCRVVEVSRAYTEARGRTLSARSKEGRAASRALELINVRIAAELAQTAVATTVNRRIAGQEPERIGHAVSSSV